MGLRLSIVARGRMNDDSARGMSLEAAAHAVDGRLEGVDGSRLIRGIAPLETARSHDLALFASRKYRRYLVGSDHAVLLLPLDLEDLVDPDRARLVVGDVRAALRTLLLRMYPTETHPGGIHSTAVVGADVVLGEGVGLGPYAVVEDGASIGADTWVGSHSVVGRGSRVGSECVLHPHVVLYARSSVGDRVVLHSGVRIGVDGFGWALVDGVPKKMPHIGGCVIGDDVEIGANSTVDRGSIGDTEIGPHAKLDNLVHLAHNVRLGAASLLAAMVGIAGSTRIGKGAQMGGQAGVINHLELGDGVQLAAASVVLRDLRDGEVVSGSPARPNRDNLRRLAHVERLPKLVERVRELERRLDAFESGNGSD